VISEVVCPSRSAGGLHNVASRLGHTQLKTTNRYVHAVDQAERQAANTLELILGGKRETG
jgi:integrase